MGLSSPESTGEEMNMPVIRSAGMIEVRIKIIFSFGNKAVNGKNN
jgi:hypothetical protein